jgi:CRISPR-associated protein Cmr2
MTYLLSISIGPVQDFIAAARKTSDLWAGSQMLSDISADAARALQQCGCDLIFPAPAALSKTDRSVPNRLLAVVKSGDPNSAAKKAREACEGLLHQKMEDALKQASRVNRTACLKQLQGFLEFYAAWWPMNNGNLAEARENVEQLMAGRKALRDFAPSESSAGIPKSSLDPGRDAVINTHNERLSEQELRRYRMRGGEMLDAISLMKRLNDPPRFVSVSRVAIDPFIRRLKAEKPEKLKELNEAAENLCNLRADLCRRLSGFPRYEDFPYDTQLVFSDPEIVPPEEHSTQTGDKDGSGLEMLTKILRQAGLGDPVPYYAILAADGDGMGQKVSEKARSGGAEELTKFSECLSDFSAKVREIVEDSHNGALVYGGGDDVLAFLPLDTALPCADALRRKFNGMTGGTMSVGIAIVHFAAHLQTAVRWAREAERDAKTHPGKNALAVHLHTRTAGEEYVAARHSWDGDPVTNRWNLWTSLLAERKLPSQAAYHLRQLAREFRGINANDVLYKEAERILKRKRGDYGAKELDDDVIETLLGAAGGKAMTPESLHDAVDEILIARKIGPVLVLPGGKGEKE